MTQPGPKSPDPQPGDRDARSPGWMVASSHRAVSATGAEVLAGGGTAGDAVLAMAAMCFVVLPGQCGVGGDAFCVWYEATTGQYRAVQGSGVGPDGGDLDFYRQRGMAALPLSGPLSVTVPGAMAALGTIHRHLGTRSLPSLWRPAVTAAREGIEVTEKTRADAQEQLAKLRADEASARVYLPGGALPVVGATLRQVDLATTLENLAADPEDFYQGEAARRCIEALVEAGAPFSGREWKTTDAPAVSTISGRYRGHVVHENPLPSPGYMVLQQAAVLDGLLSELPWLGGQALRWLAGAAALAFANRRRAVGSDTDAWAEFVTPEAVDEARRSLRSGPFPGTVSVQPDGDTTSVVAVDAAGNAASYIHSLAYTFGAGWTVPGTGIVLNDRLGRGAYLFPGHPNGVLPGRKPLHTLNAWIVARPTGQPVAVGNTPGGDGQVQWNMQVLSHLLDHRAGPQRAVAAPRLTVYPGSDADAVGKPLEVRCESRFGTQALEELRRLGAPVVVQGPFDGGGSAQVITMGNERRGGSDPRFDGLAIGG